MKSNNPILRQDTFRRYMEPAAATMTVEGTVNKTAMLFAILLATAGFTWFIARGNMGVVFPLLLVGAIGGLITALVTTFKKHLAPVTAPIYAALQGFVIGGISFVFDDMYPGIAFQAVGLTLCVMAAMLVAYRTGVIRATGKFKMGVIVATASIGLVYMASLLLGLFGVEVPLIHSAGPFGIIFSLIVVSVAALNLIIDFDFIEQAAGGGAPQFMEWYGAFALMVTLLWLYTEILRLLAKIRRK
ncbi:MAG: Bax inhibitor-1/YccA family protein [SAR202 cluster bacterium]|nr:Bax inhibitor-1/YccA family protein [SAR202 cluster bacterium]